MQNPDWKMRIPCNQELVALIEKGIVCVENHPVHHLEVGIREAILLALGGRNEFANDADTVSDEEAETGYRRRMDLLLASLEKVLPIWEKSWPDNDFVQRMMAEIRTFPHLHLSNEAQEEMEAAIYEKLEYADELTNETRSIAGVVAMAAARGLSLAVYDGFLSDDIDLARVDHEDFMANESHFYVAAAFAGGPPYPIALSIAGDAEKRKEFWLWWLTEAVPSAVNSIRGR